MSNKQKDLIKQECLFLKQWVLVLLIELCPLSELRRLSTEPPALSFGFSRESVSGWGDWGEPGAPSGLDWKTKREVDGGGRCRWVMKGHGGRTQRKCCTVKERRRCEEWDSAVQKLTYGGNDGNKRWRSDGGGRKSRVFFILNNVKNRWTHKSLQHQWH